MSRASLVIAPLLVSALVACSGDGGTTPDPGNNDGGSGGGGGGGGGTVTRTVDTVFVNGTSFTPQTLNATAGRPIVFFKQDAGILHTVTPDGHGAFSRVQSSGQGEILRVTLNTAGTYRYFCEPHQSAGMTGSLVLQ